MKTTPSREVEGLSVGPQRRKIPKDTRGPNAQAPYGARTYGCLFPHVSSGEGTPSREVGGVRPRDARRKDRRTQRHQCRTVSEENRSAEDGGASCAAMSDRATLSGVRVAP